MTRPKRKTKPFEGATPPSPPEWINFEHPELPKYFYIAILDDNGEVKTWWQRLPEHLRTKFP